MIRRTLIWLFITSVHAFGKCYSFKEDIDIRDLPWQIHDGIEITGVEFYSFDNYYNLRYDKYLADIIRHEYKDGYLHLEYVIKDFPFAEDQDKWLVKYSTNILEPEEFYVFCGRKRGHVRSSTYYKTQKDEDLHNLIYSGLEIIESFNLSKSNLKKVLKGFKASDIQTDVSRLCKSRTDNTENVEPSFLRSIFNEEVKNHGEKKNLEFLYFVFDFINYFRHLCENERFLPRRNIITQSSIIYVNEVFFGRAVAGYSTYDLCLTYEDGKEIKFEGFIESGGVINISSSFISDKPCREALLKLYSKNGIITYDVTSEIKNF